MHRRAAPAQNLFVLLPAPALRPLTAHTAGELESLPKPLEQQLYPQFQSQQLFLMGTDPGHTERHHLPEKTWPQHLIKEQRLGVQWKDRDVRWSWGNGAGKRELPLLPNSSRHRAQAGAAQQGSVCWKRPKSLPKTCQYLHRSQPNTEQHEAIN